MTYFCLLGVQLLLVLSEQAWLLLKDLQCCHSVLLVKEPSQGASNRFIGLIDILE